MSATECSFLVWGFQFTGVWDWIWNFQKVCMVNFSWLLLQVTRHSIAAWHKIEQVSDEMKYVWPTQWPERRWHFQTHGSMNVYTVWKKKLISGCGLERSVKRKKKKSDFHRDRNQSVQREKQEECMEKRVCGKIRDSWRQQIQSVCVFMCLCIDYSYLIAVWSTKKIQTPASPIGHFTERYLTVALLQG